MDDVLETPNRNSIELLNKTPLQRKLNFLNQDKTLNAGLPMTLSIIESGEN